MNNRELLENFNIKPQSIKKVGSASIITTKDRQYVMKKRNRKADSFDYLLTRNFTNFPKVYSRVDDEIELTDYIEDKNTPTEQKLQDLIYLTSMLHIKTGFYKNVDEDYIKKIYEDITTKQTEIYKFYTNLQDVIELEVYMSPANYLLIRNISMIYFSINKSKEYIERWYELIKEEPKIRYAYIHGNLKEEHIIENNDLYLISWDNSRIDLPIYDLEKLYHNSFLDINLEDILNVYNNKSPLKKEEYYLLMSLLLLPDKIDLSLNEYPKTKQVTNLVLYLDKTLTYLKNNTNKSNYDTNH